jgi:hemin uptake protein HemP
VVTPRAANLESLEAPQASPVGSNPSIGPFASLGLAASAGPLRTTLGDDERTLESRELLGGGREVRIRHGADFYRLRLTQNGKLILQK